MGFGEREMFYRGKYRRWKNRRRRGKLLLDLVGFVFLKRLRVKSLILLLVILG